MIKESEGYLIVSDFRPIREQLKITQDEAARYINVTRATYIKYEKFPETMPLGKYMRLIQWFKKKGGK